MSKIMVSGQSGVPEGRGRARPAATRGAGRAHHPATSRLRDRFGLTPAEARLAARMADGSALAAVAEALGIAKETARTQLKRVFLKTGTRRQAELVALLAGIGTNTQAIALTVADLNEAPTFGDGIVTNPGREK